MKYLTELHGLIARLTEIVKLTEGESDIVVNEFKLVTYGSTTPLEECDVVVSFSHPDPESGHPPESIWGRSDRTVFLPLRYLDMSEIDVQQAQIDMELARQIQDLRDSAEWVAKDTARQKQAIEKAQKNILMHAARGQEIQVTLDDLKAKHPHMFPKEE